MDVLELRALAGPNVHARQPMLHLLLDVSEERDARLVPADLDPVLRVLPGLAQQPCKGGTLQDSLASIEPAHLVEHVSVELLRQCGQRVGEGKTEERGATTFLVVHPMLEEPAAVEAARRAVDIVEDLCHRREPATSNALDSVARALRLTELGPTTRSLIEEAVRRGIPYQRLDEGAYVQFGQGRKLRRMQASLTDGASCLGAEIADDKERSKEVLHDAGVPVPRGEWVRSSEEAVRAAQRIGFPVVVKPLVGNHGRGITVDIQGPEEVPEAFALARAVHRAVIVEKHVKGHDFRVLLVDHRFLAVVRRDPAQVVGDGQSTVQRLVDILNLDPRRSENGNLARVDADDAMLHMLAKQGLDLSSVPEAGRRVLLRGPANVSRGGTATDVTDEVHPSVRLACERASRTIGLDITGLDIVAPTLAVPLEESGGAVVEINAAPGLRMHMEPSSGTGRDVTGPIFDMLFRGSDGRIQVVAVHGAAAEPAVHLMARLLQGAGRNTGVASQGGVHTLGALVRSGDQATYGGAQTVLRDIGVDVALLHCSTEGVLRSGLGFDRCDVAVLLPAAAEGPSQEGKEHAAVPGVILASLAPGGTLVAPPSVAMGATLAKGQRHIALASSPEDGGRIAHGAEAVRFASGRIELAGPIEAVLADAAQVPDPSASPLEAVLAAVAACHALGMPLDALRAGLARL